MVQYGLGPVVEDAHERLGLDVGRILVKDDTTPVGSFSNEFVVESFAQKTNYVLAIANGEPELGIDRPGALEYALFFAGASGHEHLHVTS